MPATGIDVRFVGDQKRLDVLSVENGHRSDPYKPYSSGSLLGNGSGAGTMVVIPRLPAI